MERFSLSLKYNREPLRPAVAWLIPGSDPGLWLQEIIDSGVSQRSCRLLVLPGSRSHTEPLGALVLMPSQARLSLRCAAYGKVAERLYLPVEAELTPAATTEELEQLLSPEWHYVFHPVVGLVGFEQKDVLTAVDLLQLPSADAQKWQYAIPGVVLPQRLTTLIPNQPPRTVLEIIQEGRDEIGTESDQLPDLPRAPEESQPGAISKAGRSIKSGFLKALQWLTTGKHGKAGPDSLAGRLSRWATEKLAAMRESLAASRNKEMHRLLRMLDDNPDEGLRYAIPLSDQPSRGVAQPSDQLSQREVDFSFSRLGSSGPADYWEMESNYYLRLLNRYRELANREQSLGRYRRAAYIYAELLGDYSAAASALTAGKHYREAAMVYQEKLDRPLEAARCLEDGGLLLEAIEIYVKLGHHEKSGDLYMALDLREEAMAQYRIEVDRYKANGQYRHAATLLEQKMASPEEAKEVLLSGWTSPGDSQGCLSDFFDLTARQGWHTEALRQVVSFREAPYPVPLERIGAGVLADVAIRYPDLSVRERAMDQARMLIAALLPRSSREEARALLSSLERLEPRDRLLSRDCSRYLSPQQSQARARTVSRGFQIERRITLPSEVVWEEAVSCKDDIYLAGWEERKLHVIRCHNGTIHHPLSGPWHVEREPLYERILLSICPTGDNFLLVHPPGLLPFKTARRFSATGITSATVTAGSIASMSDFTILGGARASHGVTWLLGLSDHELILILEDASYHVYTWSVDSGNDLLPLLSESQKLPVPCHVWGTRTVYIVLNDQLCRLIPDGPTKTISLPAQGRSLHGRPSVGRYIHLLIPMEEGAAFCSFHGNEESMQSIASEMTEPVGCFLEGNRILLADQHGLDLYGIEGDHLKWKRRLELSIDKPLSVVPLGNQQQFAVVTRSEILYGITE